jgi:hypothetical protein
VPLVALQLLHTLQHTLQARQRLQTHSSSSSAKGSAKSAQHCIYSIGNVASSAAAQIPADAAPAHIHTPAAAMQLLACR